LLIVTGAAAEDAVMRLSQAEGMPFMVKSTSTTLVLLGTLTVIVGIIAIARPDVTVFALVILFAVYAFGTGPGQGSQRARRQRSSRGPLRRVRFP
jgi:uncharacterized membrane protein HdeD (DUF308 family)